MPYNAIHVESNLLEDQYSVAVSRILGLHLPNSLLQNE